MPSLRSRARERRASRLSAEFRAGDAKAGFSLFQRYRAFKSLILGMPWPERLARANKAWERKRKEQLERERFDRLSRPYRESTRDL